MSAAGHTSSDTQVPCGHSTACGWNHARTALGITKARMLNTSASHGSRDGARGPHQSAATISATNGHTTPPSANASRIPGNGNAVPDGAPHSPADRPSM